MPLLVCSQAVKQLCDQMHHNAGCPHFPAADVAAECYCLCCRTGSSSGGDFCGCCSVSSEALNLQTQSKSTIRTNGWSSNTSISASHVHRGTTDDLSGISAKPQNSLSASDILESCTTCQLTSTSATPTTGHTTHTEFCTALVTFGTEHCRSLLPLSPLQAEGTFRLIPAPLWQEVAIPADRVCIAQTSAGQDWMLGQGSCGKVSFA